MDADAENRALRAEMEALRARTVAAEAEADSLRARATAAEAEAASLRALNADAEKRAARLEYLYGGGAALDVLIRLAQNGYGDPSLFASLCRELRGEEQVWAAIKNVGEGPHKRTRLMYAARKGHIDRVRFLLACNADISLADTRSEDTRLNSSH